MTSLKLIRQTPIDESIVCLEFKAKPDIIWQPGQYIGIEVPHANSDSGGTRRHFTIASAPHESIIRLVTRRGKSSFKQALLALKPDETIWIVEPPTGNFVWENSKRPKIFVAAGVGITPFYAILKDQAQHKLTAPVHLLYFHKQTILPFSGEFLMWSNQDPNLTITQISQGYDPALLSKYVTQLAESTIYLGGPMSVIPLLLPPYNLRPQQIIKDEFTGYSTSDY